MPPAAGSRSEAQSGAYQLALERAHHLVKCAAYFIHRNRQTLQLLRQILQAESLIAIARTRLRSITFCNSRTLPGQLCAASAFRNPSVKPVPAYGGPGESLRKYSANRGISSDARAGGMWMRTTEMRK